MLIKITNNSSDTILHTTGRVQIHREGYSDEISDYSLRFETDKIIESGYAYSLCMRARLGYNAPSFPSPLADLIYTIGSYSVRFK